eukprot:8181021-Alexandrium_andersonii.AAC.1
MRARAGAVLRASVPCRTPVRALSGHGCHGRLRAFILHHVRAGRSAGRPCPAFNAFLGFLWWKGPA